ncbi:MAG: HAD family hydrolase [Candidatus Micrarchaeia archaeon]
MEKITNHEAKLALATKADAAEEILKAQREKRKIMLVFDLAGTLTAKDIPNIEDWTRYFAATINSLKEKVQNLELAIVTNGMPEEVKLLRESFRKYPSITVNYFVEGGFLLDRNGETQSERKNYVKQQEEEVRKFFKENHPEAKFVIYADVTIKIVMQDASEEYLKKVQKELEDYLKSKGKFQETEKISVNVSNRAIYIQPEDARKEKTMEKIGKDNPNALIIYGGDDRADLPAIQSKWVRMIYLPANATEDLKKGIAELQQQDQKIVVQAKGKAIEGIAADLLQAIEDLIDLKKHYEDIKRH